MLRQDRMQFAILISWFLYFTRLPYKSRRTVPYGGDYLHLTIPELYAFQQQPR